MDIVGWIPFLDQRYGKLIVFSQSKCGTNWENKLTQLKPVTFCKTWFADMPAVDPVSAFFVCDTPIDKKWFIFSSEAGIFFDRFRIMSLLYPGDLNGELFLKLKTWCDIVQQQIFI